MASGTGKLVQVFRNAMESQEAALALESARVRNRVIAQYASGNNNINHAFALDVAFRLVFVRCHFTGGSGTATLTVTLDSAQGQAYDSILQSIAAVGTGTDAFFIPGGADVADPSAWSFQAGDTLRFKWTNPAPGTMLWGLEVGMAIAA